MGRSRAVTLVHFGRSCHRRAWYSLGGDDWYTLADYGWYSLADYTWYIIARLLTPSGSTSAGAIWTGRQTMSRPAPTE